MPKKIAIICMLLLFGHAALAAASAGPPPGDGFAPGWKKSGPALRFTEGNLFDYIDGGAELFLEFGFEELFVQHYRAEKSEMTLELYRMESPEAALGMYLLKCGTETPFPGIKARNSGNPYQLTVLKGNCFIQVDSFEGSEKLVPAMVALAARTLKSIPEGRPVRLLENLPREGLVPGSELLARGPFALQSIFTFGRGDVLRLGGKVFAVLGDYYEIVEAEHEGPDSIRTTAGGLPTYTKMFVLYPNEETAREALDNLFANLDPYLEVLSEREGGFAFKDYRDKFGVVSLRGSVMEIDINLSKESD
jgi:hypothetical protein